MNGPTIGQAVVPVVTINLAGFFVSVASDCIMSNYLALDRVSVSVLALSGIHQSLSDRVTIFTQEDLVNTPGEMRIPLG